MLQYVSVSFRFGRNFLKYLINKQDMKYTYKVTLKHFLSITVAVAKQ